MIDLRQVKFTTSANSFKNTGVFDSSIVASGTIGAGATKEFTTSITLSEDQVFSYSLAEFEEYSFLNGDKWQPIPTFDLFINTTPTGALSWYLYTKVNGPTITFILGLFNPYGATETIPNTTIPIRYVTYTLTS